MSVIFQSGYTLPAADQPLTHARIAHSRNWLSGGSALASTTAAGYFANAPLNTLTYEKWKPGATSGTWTYTHGSAVTCDYAAIGAHDLGTSGASLTVQYQEASRTNIYLYSQQFDNASWAKIFSTVTPNAAIAPDGTLTAYKLVEDSTLNAHYIGRVVDPAWYRRYTLSVYAKAAERSFIQLIYTNDAFGFTLVGAFDLVNGVCFGNRSEVTANIEDVGDGWFRCSITALANLDDPSTAPQIRVLPTYTTVTSTYQGNGVSGVFLWGAQMEGENLLSFGSEFDNVGWGKSRLTVTANAGTAPDGTLTADKLIPTTENNTHFAALSQIPVFEGKTYTSSVFVKADGYGWARISHGGFAFELNWIYVNLSTGAIGNTSTNVQNAVVTDVGSGWFHVSFDLVAIATITTTFALYVWNADSFSAFAGDGVSGILAWGGQVQEKRTTPTSYIPTTTATVTSTWHDVTPFIVPEDDSAIFAIFEPTLSQGWRINIINSTTAPEIAVIKFGTALQMERPIFGGHSPIMYARQTIMRMNESETGEYLGRSKWRTYLETNYAWQNLTAAWIKANWPTLQRAIETEPFFLAWRPLTYPEQITFGRAMGVPIPTNSGTRDLMSVELQMRALSYD